MNNFDIVTESLKNNKFSIIAGFEGSGLTSLLLSIVDHVVFSAKRQSNLCMEGCILVFSPGFPSEEISMRMLSARSGIPMKVLANGKFSNEDWRESAPASGELAETEIKVIDVEKLSLDKIYSTCAHLIKQGENIAMLIIDDLQKLNDFTDIGLRERGDAEAADTLKQLTHMLDAAVLTFVSVKQIGKEKAPSETDLRNLYPRLCRAAASAFILFRKGATSALTIVKHSEGFVGSASLLFRNDTLKFEPYANYDED